MAPDIGAQRDHACEAGPGRLMPKRTINYFGQDVTLPATTVRIIDAAADIPRGWNFC